MPRIRTSRCSRSSATTSPPASASRSPAAPAARSGRTPSPDGRWLAYVHRTGGRSRLYVKDLRSGEERQVYGDLDQDLQETWAVHGVYPNMDWTPDSRTLVFWAGGKLRRIDADGSGAAEIPFEVADSRVVIDPPRPQVDVAPDSFTTRMPRFAAVSPDGRRVVFETLGRLYIRDMSGGGAPRPLTAQDGDFQLLPAWSRDGSRIAFVSWNDQRLGEIRTVAADGSDMRTVTQQPGHYRRPQFSPDGATIVYELAGGGGLTSDRWSERDRNLPRARRRRRLDPRRSPTAATRISAPLRTASSSRSTDQQKRKLISVDLGGGNRRDHAQGELVTGYEVSPDGRTLAFRENYNVFVTPFFAGAAIARPSAARHASCRSPGPPTDGASFPLDARRPQLAWSARARPLHRRHRRLLRTAPGGEPMRAAASGVSLAITVPRRRAAGAGRPGRRADRHHGRRGRRHHRRRRRPDRRQPHPRGRPRAARSRSRPARSRSTSPARRSFPA